MFSMCWGRNRYGKPIKTLLKGTFKLSLQNNLYKIIDFSHNLKKDRERLISSS